MGALNGFDADKRMQQRQGFTVTLAGRTFHRAKLNGKLMREVIALGDDNQDGDNQDANAKDEQGIGMVYRQVALMIVDENGDGPDPDWLESELDFEVAAELLEALSPQPKSGNAGPAAS